MTRKFKVAIAYEEGFTVIVNAINAQDAEHYAQEFVDDCVSAANTYGLKDEEIKINDTVHRDARVVDVIDISEM